MLLPNEDFARKGENAFIERKRGSQTQKRVYRSNTSLEKVQIRLASENMPPKGGNFFIERKRHKQRLKSVSRAKTHINERIRVYIAYSLVIMRFRSGEASLL